MVHNYGVDRIVTYVRTYVRNWFGWVVGWVSDEGLVTSDKFVHLMLIASKACRAAYGKVTMTVPFVIITYMSSYVRTYSYVHTYPHTYVRMYVHLWRLV
jgi:hypothetical protein